MRKLASCSTVPDLARYLGMTEPDLNEIIDAGELRVVPEYGQMVVHRADLEDFLTARLLLRS